MAPKKKKGMKQKDKNQDIASYKENDPDPNSEELLYDDVDQYHRNQEKILLSNKVSFSSIKSNLSRNDEVLSVASNSDDDDEKIEEYERQLKKFKGAGNRETLGSDIASDEEQISTFEDELMSDADDDQLEEHEVLQLQKTLNNYLEEDDFGLSLIHTVSNDTKQFQQVGKDLSDLTNKEKKILLKSESPELFKLIDELKSKLTFIIQYYSNNVVINDSLKKTYLKLLLDYCVNLNFYLALKFRREDVANHPVIDRICYYSDVLKSFTSGGLITGGAIRVNKPAEISAFINELEKNHVVESDQEELEETRRAINKTIEKNRGLTPHRKKENKNPRVKHRNKYRKAKIRRKGQIREPRKEMNKYGGEISGIKPGIKRGIKMK